MKLTQLTSLAALLSISCVATLPTIATAQVTTKPDGKFRSLWGLAGSFSSGNTRATSVSLTGETVLQDTNSKWSTLGRAIYARSEEGTTAANLTLGTQYDHDLTNTDFFGVTKADYLRDRPSNIDMRTSVYGGVGRHLIRTDQNTWDAIIGVGYTQDRYVMPTIVNGENRTRYGRREGVLSESSNHKLTSATTLKQKLEVFPVLGNKGEYRATFETGLAVAMTATMQLTTGLTYRYHSDPGDGVKRYDSLFLTGISMRFD